MGIRPYLISVGLSLAMATVALVSRSTDPLQALQLSPTLASQARQPEIDYQQDLAPILAAKCTECHGPDCQEGELRLDRLPDVFHGATSGKIITSGDHRQSLLWQVVSGESPLMPPEGEPLTQAERDTIARWIDGQAVQLAPTYDQPPSETTSGHWSYQPIPVCSPPKNPESSWPRGPIDQFVLARLASSDLRPSPQADRRSLARRVSLDLVGLPPTERELAAYLADRRPGAYRRLVDRLLASPHFGEHWGRYWLDLARYADTNGYHRDTWRPIWRYRDWVIRALNENMPFDRFTIEQLAGDLLPRATERSLVATGFHRNTMYNQESGIDLEEFRVKSVVDRVATTATVWLGTTLACAECHRHPFDPFTRQEFYEFYAFFNSTADAGGGKGVQPGPLLEKLSASQQRRRKELKQQLAKRLAELQRQGRLTEAPFDKQYVAIQQAQDEFRRGLNATMVMRELPRPRATHVHLRGDYTRRGSRVVPATPAVLPAPSAEFTPDRLGLARWLVDPRNPLTARVTVNRFWEKLFGTGIVASSEDFGSQGERPSHPELLDYLARRFIDGGWNVKALLREIVTSATYRQQAITTAQHQALDPDNRLLARGPRFRMEAEMIRDTVLAASGLLSRKQGGPSVFPPQPAGLWDELAINYENFERWRTSHGSDRYRRGVYTYWRRSMAYPSFTQFDAPARESCTVRRTRTNTPLQALVLLNDPAYLEAADALANRMRARAFGSLSAGLRFGFELCTARPPNEQELATLVALYEDQHTLLTATLPASEATTHAWTTVANVLLNLDATISK